MTDAETLRALADEVEGRESSKVMDGRIWAATNADVAAGVALMRSASFTKRGSPDYTRSIDAAAALMPAGWLPEIVKVHHRWRAMGIPSPGGIAVVGFGATEPLARTSCALRAIAADIEAKEPDHD